MACHLVAITYPSISWSEFSFHNFWNASWKFHDWESASFLLIYFLASLKLRNFLYKKIKYDLEIQVHSIVWFPRCHRFFRNVFSIWSGCLTWLPFMHIPISIGGTKRSFWETSHCVFSVALGRFHAASQIPTSPYSHAYSAVDPGLAGMCWRHSSLNCRKK